MEAAAAANPGMDKQQQDIAATASDVAALRSGMESQQQNAAELVSELAALKGLLEQLVAGIPSS